MLPIQMIEAERNRQIESEGWTRSHDDQHDRGQLEDAGECYWNSAVSPGFVLAVLNGTSRPRWPWDWCWFKPYDTKRRGYFPQVDVIRCLVKAGALFMAERDRYRRRGELNSAVRLEGRVTDVAWAIGQQMAGIAEHCAAQGITLADRDSEGERVEQLRRDHRQVLRETASQIRDIRVGPCFSAEYVRNELDRIAQSLERT